MENSVNPENNLVNPESKRGRAALQRPSRR